MQLGCKNIIDIHLKMHKPQLIGYDACYGTCTRMIFLTHLNVHWINDLKIIKIINES